MRSVYRPSRILSDALAKELGLPKEHDRRIPGLDEDEATMAVEAAQAVLRGRDAATVRNLEAISVSKQGWAPTVARALGLENTQIAERAQSPAATPGPGTLRIVSNAPRPKSDAFERGEVRAGAIAELSGPGADLDAPRSPRPVERAEYEKLAAWEEKALLQVPMGAYVSRPIWDASLDARYRLVASLCSNCNLGALPPLDPCPVCGHATKRIDLPRTGELYSFTAVAAGGGPTEFDAIQDTEGAYGVGIIAFDHGIRLAAMLTESDLASLNIGQRADAVFRRLYAQEGAWRYGMKFRIQR